MRRFTAISIVAALLLSASPAWAFYETPSALLLALQSKGGPRLFSFQVNGNLEDELYFAAWVNGAHEGRTPQNTKAKANITFDLADSNTTLRMRFKMLAYMENFYLKLEDTEVWGEGALSNFSLGFPEGHWLKMPLTDDFFPEDTSNFFIDSLKQLLDHIGIEEEDIDRVFVKSHVRFDGGIAYSLKPSPLFPKEHVLVYDDVPEEGMTLSEWMQDALGGVWDEPVYSKPAELLFRETNAHIKIDTNMSDELLFSKFYISQVEPTAELVVQGTFEFSKTPVYLEIPKDIVDAEEWMRSRPALEEEEIEPLFEYPIIEKEPTPTYPTTLPSCEILYDQPEYFFLVRSGRCPPNYRYKRPREN